MGLEEADGAASPTKKAKHGRAAYTIDDWKKKCKSFEVRLIRMKQATGELAPKKGRGRPKGRLVYDVEQQGGKNLKRHVQGLLDVHTTNGAEAWSELVSLVLQSKEVKRRDDFKAMKLQIQQDVVSEIQQNMTVDVGLAVMVYCKLSHARYERLRQMMSKRYDKEKDEYQRLKTGDGIDFPVLYIYLGCGRSTDSRLC
jgi:hypothetical protein